MNLNEKAYLFLENFAFLTYKKKCTILSLFNSPQEIFTRYQNCYQSLSKILTVVQFQEMCAYLTENNVDNVLRNLESMGITVLTAVSESYPEKLKNLPDKPLVLYAKGDLSLLNTKTVGMVGTRRVTRYGKKVTENFATAFALSGVTIVSGMAEGVDTISAKSALSVGGKTIAVLGSGFNEVYPKSNLKLFEEICKNGLVLTEYKPSIKPVAYNFPVRNRIIAGLSDAVVITEASEDSGSMHTRDYCVDYNKDLFAVPGNIDSPMSVGTNKIIQTCQATCALSPEDVMENMNIKFVGVVKNQNDENLIEKISNSVSLNDNDATNLIVNTIGVDIKSFDEILEITKLDTGTLITKLTFLELSGIIEKLPNNFYKLKN